MRALAGFVLAFGAAAVLAQQPAPAMGPPAGRKPAGLEGVGIEQRLGATVPLDALLLDEAGRPVRLGKFFGTRPVVLVLAYYNCPMLCTQVLNGTVAAMRAISFDAGREYEVVTVSFDPRDKPRDAAAKKIPYVKEYGRPGAADGWHFLTASTASIERITESIGFHYRWDESRNQFAHASAIYVLTPDGRVSRYFFGIEYAPRDLRLGLIEASNRKIGTPVDEILLYCFHYDPAAGKYGAVVMNIVRVAGAVAVLVLSVFLTIMWRRDARRDRDRLQAAPAPPVAGTH